MEKYMGMKLDNRYEILEIIGSGGMAVVYKARDHRLNRLVAVKILKEELALDADFRRRFHTESQAVAMLSHPNIVAVYDVSKSDDIEYIVMELIEGITLKQYMNRKGQLNWKESLHFATQISKGLSHAHSRGIIHRDIKPHNIMILKDGSVKVADFGIARLQSSQATTLTQEALGSVHYISPEQAKGASVDARSDIYSLGVVMYEMLTSTLPFEGDSPVSVAIQHISSIPLSPRDINPEIPRGLEAITMMAMNPDLEARYQSAEDLLRDMEEFKKNPDGQIAAAAAAPAPKRPSSQNGAYVDEDVEKSRNRKKKTREEARKRKKKSKLVSTLTGIFCVLALLVAIVVFLWTFILKGLFAPSGEKITVEDFTGKLYTDVINDEEYAEIYDFELVEEENDELPAGTVISQNPAAGRNVTKDKDILIKVTLTYAIESAEIKMPDLVGDTDYRQAEIDLSAMGMEVVIKEISSDEIVEGYIVRTIPEAGKTLVAGDKVTLYVSTGPEITDVEVPDLYGMSLTSAINKLQDLGLTYKYDYIDSVATLNIVVKQSIAAGTKVPKNSEIILKISNESLASPSPSPSPSVEPSPSPSPSPTQTPSPSPTSDAPADTERTVPEE